MGPREKLTKRGETTSGDRRFATKFLFYKASVGTKRSNVDMYKTEPLITLIYPINQVTKISNVILDSRSRVAGGL